jgi:radical SAM protein (TIGR04043 family)
VIQTCIRYGEADRCRFCAIEQSLENRSTTRVKTPPQLAEVARAAVELDGVRQVVLTTGTTATPDRGARYLARCVAAIRAAVPDLPVQVQCEPPDDHDVFRELVSVGATAIGIHVESLDQAVREHWMPGKATVPLADYWAAWDAAVAAFGRNRVSTYLLVGLGEDPDELVAGAARLVEHGVYPFVVPFRPLAGTLARSVPAPSAALLEDVTGRVAAVLAAAGMRGEDQGAGCAACGACSALPTSGG